MAIPDRNLALELVRVTETAALAAAPWVGRGDKDLADGASVAAMRAMINTVDFFTPIVDDAYDFGRIAAANALSDVYAMGGKPLFANAILRWQNHSK